MPQRINPQGPVGRFADSLMVPAMYLLSGTFYEVPQSTHFWNNQKLDYSDIRGWIDRSMSVAVSGDANACKAWWFGLPRFHAPVLGGWRRYVVLEWSGYNQVNAWPWHVGWIVDGGVVGVSRIPMRTRFARCLIGPRRTTFFAMLRDGVQVRLARAGEGVIGYHGQFRNAPLL